MKKYIILIITIAFSVLLACRKNAMEEPQPIDKKESLLGCNNKSSSKRIAIEANCDCPSFIQLLGNSTNGGKIKITGNTTGNIAIGNDNGIQTGNSGVWLSNNTYTSTALTLSVTCPDASIQQCIYNIDGNLVSAGCTPDITQVAAISSIDGTVTITWTSICEDGLQMYSIDRLETNTNEAAIDIIVTIPQGNGTGYSEFDFPGIGTYVYTIKAITALGTAPFPNGTTEPCTIN